MRIRGIKSILYFSMVRRNEYSSESVIVYTLLRRLPLLQPTFVSNFY